MFVTYLQLVIYSVNERMRTNIFVIDIFIIYIIQHNCFLMYGYIQVMNKAINFQYMHKMMISRRKNIQM